MGFTKLDEHILQSSIMAEPGETFKVWIAILASTGADGIARVSSTFLSAACYLPIDATDAAIATLEGPDPRSRGLADDGRRIRRVDGGYFVINHEKYRSFSYSDNPESVRKREYRHGERKNRDGYVYFAGTRSRIKIGFSTNPWARLAELKIAVPDLELLAVYEGTTDDEKAEHEKFTQFHVDREWYQACPEIKQCIRDILGRSGTEAGHSASASASSSSDLFREFLKTISPTDRDLWSKAYPACDVDTEAAQALAWIDGNPAKGRKSNYRRFFVAWLKRSQDRGGTQRRTPGQLSPDEQKKRAAWAKEDG